MAEKIRAFRLFATHYFELTSLPDKVSGACNIHLGATEYNENIVFLHSIEEGPANKSYGIQVAKLAGLPEEVISLARQELALLEAGSHAVISPVAQPESAQPTTARSEPRQSELFLPSINPQLQKRLEQLKPDDLSPRDALELLYELKNLL
jgi:DNA mismatch repair protein MutS